MINPGRHIGIHVLLAFALILLKSCYKEIPLEEMEAWQLPGRVLEFDGVYACSDPEEQLLLYTLPSDTMHSFSPYVRFGDYQSVELAGKELKANAKNDLGRVVLNQPYPVRARKGNKTVDFTLFFTNFPLVHIHTGDRIQDEPKVLAWLEMAYSDPLDASPETSLYSGYAGIEIRGRTSASFEKKSYGLELWRDRYGTDESAPLLG